MAKQVINIGNWSNLDINTMTNLYLYGTTGTPINYNDRIRSANAPTITVNVDMGSFLATGPGKYFTPATIPFVQDFFDTHAYEQSYNLQGTYTVARLISILGLTTNQQITSVFGCSLEQRTLDPASSDYGARAYIYNGQSYRLSMDTVFVFDGANSHLEDVKLRMLDENFDFTSNWFVNLFQSIILTPQIDPPGSRKDCRHRVAVNCRPRYFRLLSNGVGSSRS
jgi:hypothetical protein